MCWIVCDDGVIGNLFVYDRVCVNDDVVVDVGIGQYLCVIVDLDIMVDYCVGQFVDLVDVIVYLCVIEDCEWIGVDFCYWMIG